MKPVSVSRELLEASPGLVLGAPESPASKGQRTERLVLGGKRFSLLAPRDLTLGEGLALCVPSVSWSGIAAENPAITGTSISSCMRTPLKEG